MDTWQTMDTLDKESLSKIGDWLPGHSPTGSTVELYFKRHGRIFEAYPHPYGWAYQKWEKNFTVTIVITNEKPVYWRPTSSLPEVSK